MHTVTTVTAAVFALLIATAAAPPIPGCIEIPEGECKTVDIPLGAAPLGGEWADSSSQFPALPPKVMDEDPSLYGDDFLGSDFSVQAHLLLQPRGQCAM